MSAKVETREAKVMQRIRIYGCDGPACTVKVERPETLNHANTDVPEGWLILTVSPGLIDKSAVPPPQYYCSRDCLADAVVP